MMITTFHSTIQLFTEKKQQHWCYYYPKEMSMDHKDADEWSPTCSPLEEIFAFIRYNVTVKLLY